MSFSSSFDIYLIDLILAIVNHLLWQWMQSDFMSLGCFFSLQYESCLLDALETWVVQLLRTFPIISYFPFLIVNVTVAFLRPEECSIFQGHFISFAKKSFSAVSINFIRFLYNISTALGIYKLKKGTVK